MDDVVRAVYENAPLEAIKDIIKNKFQSASQSFITIGYYLKNIRDRELYRKDGYKDIWEFAQTEFGISMSTASRFMAINNKFSINGNSPMLQEEYQNFGSSKLQEMLTLSEEQIEQITEDTTVAEIKKMKKKNKPDPKPIATSQEKLIEDREEPLDEQIEGQTSIQEDFPEILPENEKVAHTGDASVESIQELPKPVYTAIEHLKNVIGIEEDAITEMRDRWKKNNPDALLKHETILLALKLHLTDLEYPVPVPEPEVIEQPELPILKNNDQRKEWIDNYTSWPLWIDQPLTGEKYYRYNLSGAVAIVVRVSKKHLFERYKETKNYEYGAEQYYLLGVKITWSANNKSPFIEDASRTFYECATSKSELVDYLRYFQKK